MTAAVQELHLQAPEVFSFPEALGTVEAVQELLDNRFNLAAVARQLAVHQPGEAVDMSSFERALPVEGLSDYAQPHFYQRYVGDKRGAVTRTPLERLALADIPGLQDSLVLDKREDAQKFAEAFKVRGAMLAALDAVRTNPDVRIFTTASAGNHALGLLRAVQVLNDALIASGKVRTDENDEVFAEDKELLYEAHIYCSRTISPAKYNRLEQNGAKIFVRDSLEEALPDASLQADQSTTTAFIHPFDDEHVIAGQATMGLELLFDSVDQGVNLKSDNITVCIPVGGGGLFTGIASVWEWAKSEGVLHPDARLVAAEMEGCDSAARELAGQEALGDRIDTDTEGLATQAAGRKTLPVIEWYGEGGVLVVPKPYVILAASELAKVHGDKVPELAAVVSLAATLYEADRCTEGSVSNASSGRKVIVTLTTGCNVAPELLTRNSREFARHEDDRVVAAATELGHRAMRLAFLNVSREHLRLAAEQEAADPSIVVSARTLERAARWTRPHKPRSVARVALANSLSGGTVRDYVW